MLGLFKETLKYVEEALQCVKETLQTVLGIRKEYRSAACMWALATATSGPGSSAYRVGGQQAYGEIGSAGGALALKVRIY
jgi:hypothetical protein